LEHFHAPTLQRMFGKPVPKSLGELSCFDPGIGVDLIYENGPLFASMPDQVPLPITIDIEAAHPATALNRRLPNSGMHGPPSPRDVARLEQGTTSRCTNRLDNSPRP
jgi:hypothetical protein